MAARPNSPCSGDSDVPDYKVCLRSYHCLPSPARSSLISAWIHLSPPRRTAPRRQGEAVLAPCRRATHIARAGRPTARGFHDAPTLRRHVQGGGARRACRRAPALVAPAAQGHRARAHAGLPRPRAARARRPADAQSPHGAARIREARQDDAARRMLPLAFRERHPHRVALRLRKRRCGAVRFLPRLRLSVRRARHRGRAGARWRDRESGRAARARSKPAASPSSSTGTRW